MIFRSAWNWTIGSISTVYKYLDPEGVLFFFRFHPPFPTRPDLSFYDKVEPFIMVFVIKVKEIMRKF